MAKQLDITLLGGIGFALDGKLVDTLPNRVGQALLVYLACQPMAVTRSELAHLFFQNTTPEQARANLRRSLSRIKKNVGDLLESDRLQVGLSADVTVVVDALVFDDALKETRGQGSAEKNNPTTSLSDTLALYNGDFLSGFYLREAPEFEEWMIAERERLRLLAIQGLSKLVVQLRTAGEYEQALEQVTRLLAIEQLLETAHRDKMLLLMRMGQRGAAMRHFQAAADIFAEELGIGLEEETVALFERIARLKAQPPSVLPVQRRNFIGRNQDLAHLKTLITQPGKRLITLFGTGGIGKTRIALEATRQLYAEKPGLFLDGIYFVELAAATSAEASASQIAQTMNQRLGGNQPATEQIVNLLRGKECLLVLDNFEQLVENSAEFIISLLDAAPDLKLLITSRERLQLYAETVYDLDGLPLPAQDADSATVLGNDAVQLFLYNLRQQQTHYQPADADIANMAAICRLLHGVPLGIELAAGWARDYDLPTIAAEIRSSLDFLATQMRDVPERQRSLRAVFLHSWRLLSAELQPTFANLSVFSNRFTIEAADAVASASKADLAALNDKSLLQQIDEDWYAIHPLLREFSAEQISAETLAHLRNQHSNYFTTLLHTKTSFDHRSAYLKSLPQLTPFHDDMLFAWRWAVDALLQQPSPLHYRRVQTLRRTLLHYHYQRNWFYPGAQLFAAARERLELADWHTGDDQQRLLHTQLMVHEKNLRRVLGVHEDLFEPVKAVIPFLTQMDDKQTLFEAYQALVDAGMKVGDFEHTEERLNIMERLARELKRPVLHGLVLILRSYYVDSLGEPERSIEVAHEGLGLYEEIDDSFYQAFTLDGIARRLMNLGRVNESTAALEKQYAITVEHDIPMIRAYALKGLAYNYRIMQAFDKSAAVLAEARQLMLELNDSRTLVEIDHGYALLAMDQGQFGEMVRYLRASTARARRLDMQF